MADLKLMCKHALLLNGKKNYNEDEVIDENAEILKNSSYNIITATMEELNKSEEIKKYYSEETMSYDYMGYYEKEFKDLSKNSILNAFYSGKHKELNTDFQIKENKDEIFQSNSKINNYYIYVLEKEQEANKYYSSDEDFNNVIESKTDKVKRCTELLILNERNWYGELNLLNNKLIKTRDNFDFTNMNMYLRKICEINKLESATIFIIWILSHVWLIRTLGNIESPCFFLLVERKFPNLFARTRIPVK
jgi:hypothetical protein